MGILTKHQIFLQGFVFSRDLSSNNHKLPTMCSLGQAARPLLSRPVRPLPCILRPVSVNVRMKPIRAAPPPPPPPPPAIAPEYGYVLGALCFGAVVIQGMSFVVERKRLGIGLQYPDQYATAGTEDEKKFNCAQSALNNVLDTAPMYSVIIAVLGLMRPITAASLAALYFLTKLAYFLGYSTGDPQKFKFGSFASFYTLVGTVGFSLYSGGKFIGLY